MIRVFLNEKPYQADPLGSLFDFLKPIYILSQYSEYQIDKELYYANERDYIVELNDSESLELTVQSSLPYLFDSHYYFYYGYPVIKLNYLPNESLLNQLASEYQLHGYEKVLFITTIQESIALINFDTLLNTSKQLAVAKDWSTNDWTAFFSSQFVYCESLNDLISFDHALKCKLESSSELRLVFSRLKSSEKEHEHLFLQYNWTKSQLDNHKTYLSLMKEKVNDLQIFGILYGKVAGFIGQWGFTRKMAKQIFHFIKRLK